MFVGFDLKNSKRLLRDFRTFEALMDLEERAAAGKSHIQILLCQICFVFSYKSTSSMEAIVTMC